VSKNVSPALTSVIALVRHGSVEDIGVTLLGVGEGW